MPYVLYEIVSVTMNMAGNAENIPPNTVPPVFAIKTVNITINPPNMERITRCFSGCIVLPVESDLINKYFSIIIYENSMTAA